MRAELISAMETKILDKKDIPAFVSELTSGFQVFAPVRKKEGVMFAAVTSSDDICFDAANTKKSVKEHFLPQREQLFAYKEEEIREPSFPDMPMVVLGVRPCDARSLAILDNVFNSQDYPDPYYLNKRSNTLVIAMGCAAPESTCFCTSIGGDPFATEGADVLMVDTGAAYVLQPVTEKGNGFLAARKALKNPDAAHGQAQKKIMEGGRAALKPQVQPAEVKKKLDENFESPLWATLHEKCLGCGICTFLCPTCHCFDMLDESIGTAGERIRIWDSCMYPLFTFHGSGHNPRNQKLQRVRQRFMHKLKYYVDKYANGVACVGCGRCVQFCPVNIDIRRVAGMMTASCVCPV